MTLPAGYTLRTALPTDAETVQDQRDAMFTDMGQGGPGLERARTSALDWHRRALASGLYRGFLVETGGEVVAGAGVLWQDLPPSPSTFSGRRAYVLNVYVQPEHRGRGLSRRLLERVLDECRAQGVQVVTRHASEAARSLYERTGFKPTSELRLVLEEL